MYPMIMKNIFAENLWLFHHIEALIESGREDKFAQRISIQISFSKIKVFLTVVTSLTDYNFPSVQ